MLPKITFSILCYNYGRYLDQAIRSCLEQGSSNFMSEVLVINDGSTDNTEEVCARYQGRIKVINEGNKGFPSSLTRAIFYANGDYVFLLDADDYFLRDKVSAFLPHLLNGKLYVHDLILPLFPHNLYPEVTAMGGGSTSTIAVNRKAALDILPVENELSFHVLKEMGHGFTLNRAYTVYRYHHDSMTNRTEPGKWNIYLAGVTHRLASRVEELMISNKAPEWFLSEYHVKKVAATYRAQAFYNELEAALECKKSLQSFIACMKMIQHAHLSKSGINTFHLKMLIKTLLGRPSFRRCAEN